MPRLFNVGSLNIDLVYRVPGVARPGETLGARSLERFAGGKGANQSVAAARAGAAVSHVGCVGEDGRWLVELLQADGVDCGSVRVDPAQPTGQAIIQVGDDGENAIVLWPGANHATGPEPLDKALSPAGADDWLLTQNETANAAAAIAAAAQRGMRVAFNPAPMTDDVAALPLDGVSLLVVNETEAEALAGRGEVESVVAELGARVAGLAVVTLGAKGAIAGDGRSVWRRPGRKVEPVADTTAAGDTFVGYLVAATMAGQPVESALDRAGAAAALSVTRSGAIPSIPHAADVDAALRGRGGEGISPRSWP